MKRIGIIGAMAQEVAQTSLGRDDIAALTRRELEILQLLARGMSGRTIAKNLGLSAKTIQNNLSQVRAKLDATGDAARQAVFVE